MGPERFHHFQSDEEGLSPPHNQLLCRYFNGAMGRVVRLAVEVHLLNDYNK